MWTAIAALLGGLITILGILATLLFKEQRYKQRRIREIQEEPLAIVGLGILKPRPVAKELLRAAV